MFRTRHLAVLTLLVAAAASPAVGQTSLPAPAKPCTQPEFSQFDFWVGNWDAAWPGAKPDEVQHGRNTIRKVLDDCVVQEQFDGGASTGLHGISVSMYNPGLKKWQQTWVDNQGGYLDFVGEFSNGQMVLSRHGKNQKGLDIEQRMVYKNISHDAFDWSWEQSSDGGKTWTVAWPIHYSRSKQ